jgi:hypothetical protein
MTFSVACDLITNQRPVWSPPPREAFPELRETTMARKALRFLLPASVVILAVSQWREIVRYLKISQMSRGDGHPQFVPAVGQHSYPRRSGAGTPDGTGDFDSAARGGGPAAH